MSDVPFIITGSSLVKCFQSGLISNKPFFAVQGVDISIHDGEIYALVGESGSGKSTLGKMLVGLIEPTNGRIFYHGDDITKFSGIKLAELRRKVQVIPQHPEDAFNPRWKLSKSINEPLRVHRAIKENGHMQKFIMALLHDTGLPHECIERYPHQLSGGELQRAAIARALALEPDFILCDEPTSMLDVSVQASIIQLLLKLHESRKISYLFITHDLHLAECIADRVGVMYKGRIVEEGPDILKSPMHPYTQSILSHNKSTKSEIYECPPDSCPFFPQCHKKTDICLTNPPYVTYGDRRVQCHNVLHQT